MYYMNTMLEPTLLLLPPICNDLAVSISVGGVVVLATWGPTYVCLVERSIIDGSKYWLLV